MQLLPVTTSRHLREVEAERDTEHAECVRLRRRVGELEAANRAAKETLGFATRAAGMIDSAQVTGLKNQVKTLERQLADAPTVAELQRQIAMRDETLRGLAEERNAAVDALSRLSDAPVWTPEAEKDPLQLARDERDARRALTEQLAILQRASEALDAHRNDQPWIKRPEATA